MDVVSLCALPTSSLVWQPSATRWALTVVCKATYRLEPGTAPLAPEQEAINETEGHWDDDPKRSVYSPNDLVPEKRRVDIVLVGSAYARNGQMVRSLVARLCVAGVDKAIEVFCPRVRTRDGEIREGKRWAKMPLLYERASGGPSTENPVGISRAGSRDQYGQSQLPNLQPPGVTLKGDELPSVIGFGPIAASWSTRQRWAPRGTADEALCCAPFGEGYDARYFQIAPLDQQLDALRPSEKIILENLHPKHARLTTALADTRPRALVQMPKAASRELVLVADTLWIDSDRALCTLTFRAHIELDGPAPQGRILVATRSDDQPIDWATIAPAPPTPRQKDPSQHEIEAEESLDSTEITQTEDPESLMLDTSVLDPSADPAVLPFVAAPPGWKPPAVITFGPPPRANASASGSAGTQISTQKLDMTDFRAVLPAWLEAGPPPTPDLPKPPAPLFSPLPAAPAVVPPKPALLPLPVSAGVDSAPPLGLLDASNAAAGEAPRPATGVPVEAKHSPVPGAPIIVEVLFHDPSVGAWIDRETVFSAWKSAPPAKPPSPTDAVAEAGEDAKFAQVYRVITQGTPQGSRELEAALDAAEEQSPPTPPLVLLAGDLELCFDDTEMLKAVIAAASPLAGTDKKLHEVLELASEMVKTPLLGTADIAQGLSARIHEAWTRVNRLFSPNYLAIVTERSLLEQRHYQRRALLSATWIRALLAGPGFAAPLPVYLPASLEKRLPLFRRFPARLLGEVVWQQDQYETSPFAIRVLALARVSTRVRARPAKAPRKP